MSLDKSLINKLSIGQKKVNILVKNMLFNFGGNFEIEKSANVFN